MVQNSVSYLPARLAFLFDMDGVIIDSNPLHTESWRVYLDRQGLDIPDFEARMLGKRNDQIVRDFFGQTLTAEQVFDHGAAKEELYREMMHAGRSDRLVPGVVAFLDRHAEVPAAVASNAEPANLKFVLEIPELHGRFKVCVDGHEVKRPKPDPEIYVEAARRLGANIRNCIVFEDSLAGAAAGKASGAWVVGVLTNGHPLDDVDLKIKDFRDPNLEPWLRALQPRA